MLLIALLALAVVLICSPLLILAIQDAWEFRFHRNIRRAIRSMDAKEAHE